MRGRTLKDHINEKMAQPEFKRAWEALDSEFSLIKPPGPRRAPAKHEKSQFPHPSIVRLSSSALSSLPKGSALKENLIREIEELPADRVKDMLNFVHYHW